TTVVGRPSGSTRGASIDQAPLDRPAAELVAVRELELSQHRADVRLDRLHRNRELARDLLVEIAAGDQAQHLALPKRQLIELRIDLGLGDLAGEGVEDEPGEAGGEHRVALADP